MKRYPLLQVECGPGQEPVQIRFRGQALQVLELLECWQDTGCWWAGESEKTFYRLVFEDQSVREIFYDRKENSWYLYKTYD
ncbi:MAG: hypothetical protein GYA42_01580 [Syntrophomonadaceae bacterium]|nr:hypothetical protein [Syntrophomonadaceae bacterium]